MKELMPSGSCQLKEHRLLLPWTAPGDYGEEERDGTTGAEDDDTTVRGAVSQDGQTAWLYGDSGLEVFSPSTGQSQTVWTRQEGGNSRVLTTVAFRTVPCVAVSLEGDDGSGVTGLVCILDLRVSRVVRAFSLPRQATSLAIISEGEGGREIRYFSPLLQSFRGVLSAGTAGGNVFIFDLCLDVPELACNELSPLDPFFISLSEAGQDTDEETFGDSVLESSYRHSLADERRFQCVHLFSQPTPSHFYYRKPDDTVAFSIDTDDVHISCLEFMESIGELCVGFNFGGFQIWKLDPIALDFTGKLAPPANQAPVVAFAHQKPDHDPRKFNYLWVAYSRDDCSLPACVQLYLLSYDRNQDGSLEDGEDSLFCQDLVSVALRFEEHLCPAVPTATGSKLIVCYTLEHSVQAEDPTESTLDRTLVVLAWQVQHKREQKEEDYEEELEEFYSTCHLALFDINRWYQAQMPRKPRLDKSGEDICSFFSQYSIDQQSSQCLALRVLPSSLSQYSTGKRTTGPEQLMYPSSLSFNAVLLYRDGSSYSKYLGLQRQVLSLITQQGPASLLDPSHACSQLQQVFVLPKPLTPMSKMEEREALLDVLLSHGRVDTITACAKEWSSGELAVPDCDLRFLLRWSWTNVVALRDAFHQSSECLFNCSGEQVDHMTRQTLHEKSNQLSHVHAVIQCLHTLSHSVPTTQSGVEDLEVKVTASAVLALYIKVTMWLLRVGLLPESSACPDERSGTRLTVTAQLGDDGSASGSVSADVIGPYPWVRIREAYEARRRRLTECVAGPRAGVVGVNPVPQSVGAGTRRSPAPPPLLVDALIGHCGPELARLFAADGEGSSRLRHPPPRVHSLAAMFLLQDCPESLKHALLLYTLLDVVSPVVATAQGVEGESDCVDRDAKFAWVEKLLATEFSYPDAFIRMVRSVWLLDHEHFNVALMLLGDSSTIKLIPDWLSTLVLDLFLGHGQMDAALQYVRVRQAHCGYSAAHEFDTVLGVLLGNGLVAEALQLVRQEPSRDTEGPFLHFLDVCNKMGQLPHLVVMPLMARESESLCSFLRKHREDLLVMGLLQTGRVLEALKMEDDFGRAAVQQQQRHLLPATLAHPQGKNKREGETKRKADARQSIMSWYQRLLHSTGRHAVVTSATSGTATGSGSLPVGMSTYGQRMGALPGKPANEKYVPLSQRLYSGAGRPSDCTTNSRGVVEDVIDSVRDLSSLVKGRSQHGNLKAVEPTDKLRPTSDAFLPSKVGVHAVRASVTQDEGPVSARTLESVFATPARSHRAAPSLSSTPYSTARQPAPISLTPAAASCGLPESQRPHEASGLVSPRSLLVTPVVKRTRGAGNTLAGHAKMTASILKVKTSQSGDALGVVTPGLVRGAREVRGTPLSAAVGSRVRRQRVSFGGPLNDREEEPSFRGVPQQVLMMPYEEEESMDEEAATQSAASKEEESSPAVEAEPSQPHSDIEEELSSEGMGGSSSPGSSSYVTAAEALSSETADSDDEEKGGSPALGPESSSRSMSSQSSTVGSGTDHEDSSSTRRDFPSTHEVSQSSAVSDGESVQEGSPVVPPRDAPSVDIPTVVSELNDNTSPPSPVARLTSSPALSSSSLSPQLIPSLSLLSTSRGSSHLSSGSLVAARRPLRPSGEDKHQLNVTGSPVLTCRPIDQSSSVNHDLGTSPTLGARLTVASHDSQQKDDASPPQPTVSVSPVVLCEDAASSEVSPALGTEVSEESPVPEPVKAHDESPSVSADSSPRPASVMSQQHTPVQEQSLASGSPVQQQSFDSESPTHESVSISPRRPLHSSSSSDSPVAASLAARTQETPTRPLSVEIPLSALRSDLDNRPVSPERSSPRLQTTSSPVRSSPRLQTTSSSVRSSPRLQTTSSSIESSPKLQTTSSVGSSPKLQTTSSPVKSSPRLQAFSSPVKSSPRLQTFSSPVRSSPTRESTLSPRRSLRGDEPSSPPSPPKPLPVDTIRSSPRTKRLSPSVKCPCDQTPLTPTKSTTGTSPGSPVRPSPARSSPRAVGQSSPTRPPTSTIALSPSPRSSPPTNQPPSPAPLPSPVASVSSPIRSSPRISALPSPAASPTAAAATPARQVGAAACSLLPGNSPSGDTATGLLSRSSRLSGMALRRQLMSGDGGTRGSDRINEPVKSEEPPPKAPADSVQDSSEASELQNKTPDPSSESEQDDRTANVTAAPNIVATASTEGGSSPTTVNVAPAEAVPEPAQAPVTLRRSTRTRERASSTSSQGSVASEQAGSVAAGDPAEPTTAPGGPREINKKVSALCGLDTIEESPILVRSRDTKVSQSVLPVTTVTFGSLEQESQSVTSKRSTRITRAANVTRTRAATVTSSSGPPPAASASGLRRSRRLSGSSVGSVDASSDVGMYRPTPRKLRKEAAGEAGGASQSEGGGAIGTVEVVASVPRQQRQSSRIRSRKESEASVDEEALPVGATAASLSASGVGKGASPSSTGSPSGSPSDFDPKTATGSSVAKSTQPSATEGDTPRKSEHSSPESLAPVTRPKRASRRVESRQGKQLESVPAGASEAAQPETASADNKSSSAARKESKRSRPVARPLRSVKEEGETRTPPRRITRAQQAMGSGSKKSRALQAAATHVLKMRLSPGLLRRPLRRQDSGGSSGSGRYSLSGLRAKNTDLDDGKLKVSSPEDSKPAPTTAASKRKQPASKPEPKRRARSRLEQVRSPANVPSPPRRVLRKRVAPKRAGAD